MVEAVSSKMEFIVVPIVTDDRQKKFFKIIFINYKNINCNQDIAETTEEMGYNVKQEIKSKLSDFAHTAK